ncbi:DNRLRE domain-containing protein [Spongiactinospora rosea]|nr:DNRLRE domain-containing protein [Spongiactinospora rosea]
MAVTLTASLAPASPALADSQAPVTGSALLTKIGTWLTTPLTWLRETLEPEPEGGTRPAEGMAPLPGRADPPPTPRKAAKPGKRVKELTGERTAHNKLFELEDGRRQAEVSAVPAHYRDAKGVWRDIDPRVRPVAEQGFVLGNDATGFSSRFGDTTGKLAQIALGDRRVTIALPGEAKQITPKAEGSKVTYPGVWDGADLVYVVTPEGLKELIVLSKPPTAPLSFTVNSEGLKPVQNADGSIAFTADDGTAVFTVPKPFMADSAKDPASPYGLRHTDAVKQDLVEKDGQTTITITPDSGWLAAPDRKWPVLIDPTFRLSPERFDTYVDSAKKTTNFDAAWQLPVGKTATGINRALMRFNIPSEIPIGSRVDEARLETYFDQALGEAGPVTVEAREITSEWDSYDVTWNTQPTYSSTVAATVTRRPGEVSRWHAFNVTSVVNGWLSSAEAPMHGIALKAADESAAGKVGGPVYESSEDLYGGDGMIGDTASHPKLIITWGKPSVTLSPGPVATALGSDLTWTPYADPTPGDASDDLVEYRLYRYCPSGCQNGNGQSTSDDGLVATLSPDVAGYTDTSSGGDPYAVYDPAYTHEATYRIEAVLANGEVVPSQELRVILPRPGEITTVVAGSADTTLASGEPSAGHDGKRLQVGNTATAQGNTRAVVKFEDFAAKVPEGAQITDASLSLWSANATGSGVRLDAHRLTKGFDESATWATPWTTPGGDVAAPALGSATGLTAAPGWRRLTVTGAAKAWIADPAANHGLLVKVANEAGTAKQSISFLSTEADEPLLRPRLRVTYRDTSDGASTFYAPGTPDRLDTAAQTQVPVVVTNTTDHVWPAASTELGYHWTQPDGTDVSTPANQIKTRLPEDLAPGQSTVVAAAVTAPELTGEGTNHAEAATLSWDVWDGTGWKSGSHRLPRLPQRVRLEAPTSDQLGAEKFYTYSGKNTGAGGTALVNAYSGNLVWGYNAFSNPSRGPQTFARMTYNSLDTSSSSAGYGWSLQTSSLQRLGSPLTFHPTWSNWPQQLRLTDGDGTTHTWKLDTHGRPSSQCNPSICDYTHPKGVHLYLQRVARPDDPTRISRDPLRQWVFTKPDRTQFFFDEDGYQSAIVDKNGNTMTFSYERRTKCWNKVTKFLQHITDATGRRTLTIDYYKRGQDYTYIDGAGREVSARRLSNSHIIDNIKSITDIAGRKVTFTYTLKGELARTVDGAGDAQAKTFGFDYDSGWGIGNTKLTGVTDPRGNTTRFTYHRTHSLFWCKLRVASIVDRLGGVTGFDYDTGPFTRAVRTTVTDPLRHSTRYLLDAYGRATSITNAKNETTAAEWDDDHNTIKLTEANGALTTWTYDTKTGFPLTLRDAEANANGTAPTTLVYQTGLNGHVADLVEKTSPEGRKWAFGYDARGNLKTVTDPLGVASSAAGDYTTSYEYDGHGQLLRSVDANGNPASYGDYHATGYPAKITDAYGNITTTGYDVRGNVLSVTDALGKKTTQTYDVFKRPLENRVPKDQAAGKYITTPAPEYDRNDNITTMTAPNGATSNAVYDRADQLLESLLPKDTPDGPERKASMTYDLAGNLITQTEPKGNLTVAPGDFTTSYVYDPIYQLTDVLNAERHKITYTYDNVGNVTKVVDPRKNATTDPADHTVTTTYDRNHQVKTVKDAAGHQTATTYDRDGLVTATTDQEGNTTHTVYDRRGAVIETKVPHSSADGVVKYTITRFEYDQVGNKTKTITPRGVETTDDPGDFVNETKYDKLNRPIEEIHPFDRDDARYNTPDSVRYVYDAVSRLKEISHPPSHGQAVRNVSTTTYWDNGWTKTSTDPWDIQTSYDYNELGLQTNRTVTSAGGSSQRAQDWSYYPDGKTKTHSDNGVPLDIDAVLADNSDTTTKTTGTWTRPAGSPTKSADLGYDHAVASAGTGKSSLTWNLTPPETGTYKVQVRYPAGATATNARYLVKHASGTADVTHDQTKKPDTWVTLGEYEFTKDTPYSITLTDKANGTVAADAVQFVRDTDAADGEKKDFTYSYDPNANLIGILDRTSTAKIDDWDIAYTGLNQIQRIIEKLDGTAKNTTTYAYNENGAVTRRTHDKTIADYGYDVRDLVNSITNRKSTTDTDPKVTRYTYTPRAERLTETKGNGNTVTYDYFLDGLLRHSLEKKPNGTVVAEHTIGYQGNLHRARDEAKIQNADDPGKYLEHTYTYAYDPRDRIAKTVKTPVSGAASTETYFHDANSNVYEENVKGKETTFAYDRNRLISTTTGGATANHNYDPYGRLRSITGGGTTLEKYVYDGFDHVKRHEKLGEGNETTVTTYSYDPLDRTTSKTEKEGTDRAKTTAYSYLGLSEEVLDEEVAGKLTKSFQYGPWGERLSQVKPKDDGGEESSYYGHNPHTDVETLTKENGDTRATYGYTAYGKNDDKLFTGVDKPDPDDPAAKEEYNPYRFNSKRWDNSTGMYDMGFRDYNPGLNRFLTLDAYNGALADLSLGLDPWTANRYAFTGGNPISGIELDGHIPEDWANGKNGGYRGYQKHITERAKKFPRNANITLPEEHPCRHGCPNVPEPSWVDSNIANWSGYLDGTAWLLTHDFTGQSVLDYVRWKKNTLECGCDLDPLAYWQGFAEGAMPSAPIPGTGTVMGPRGIPGAKLPPGRPTKEDLQQGIGLLPKDYINRTVGILDVGGDQLPLISGSGQSQLLKTLPGRTSENSKHVEAHAAAFLRMNKGIRQAVLYIDYPEGACGYCRSALPTMLPPGTKLWIVSPRGTEKYVGNWR